MIKALPRTALLASVTAALAFAAAPAHAGQVFNIDVPFSDADTNPCNGETVTVNGFLHAVNTETDNPNGGFHTGLHSNLHDVTGVGDQGNTYRVTLAAEGVVNQVSANEFTAEEHILFVANGLAPNFQANVLFHVTADANGNQTATVDHESTSCQG